MSIASGLKPEAMLKNHSSVVIISLISNTGYVSDHLKNEVFLENGAESAILLVSIHLIAFTINYYLYIVEKRFYMLARQCSNE